MIEAWGGLLNSLKETSPVIFTGLSIACGIILFGSDNLLETIGLIEFKDNYKAYVGACLVLSVSIVFAHIVSSALVFFKSIFKEWQKSRYNKKLIEARISNLTKLTSDEKAYLAPYILNGKTTQYFLEQDGIKGSLEAKGILFCPSSMGNIVSGFPYNIQPWAREHLENNPELLDGFTPNIEKYNPY